MVRLTGFNFMISLVFLGNKKKYTGKEERKIEKRDGFLFLRFISLSDFTYLGRTTLDMGKADLTGWVM